MNTLEQSQEHRLLRLREVESITGLKGQIISRMVKRGEFPRPVYITNTLRRAIAWRSDEVATWIDERPRANKEATV